MPVHSKKAWAEMCGLSTGNLSNYVKRGEVIYSGDFVDDAVPTNRDFLTKRQSYLKSKGLNPEKSPVVSPDPVPVKKPAKEKKTRGDMPGLYELKIEKLIEDIQKTELENAILSEKLLKVTGESIPVEMVKALFSEYGRIMSTTLKNAMERNLIQWGKINNASREQIGRARKDIIDSINEANDTAISETKKEIKKIIQITSNKKEVGEHE
jgi:hypothetical protein